MKQTRIAMVFGTAALLAACTSMQQPAAPSATPAAAGTALPAVPAPAPVSLDARTTALLLLDFNVPICQSNPACVATLPAMAALAAKARAAKVPVFYSTTTGASGPNPIVQALAPQAGDPVVSARADKFIDTNLAEQLRQRKLSTLVVAGTAANGAVMYSSFHANALGFTVVVADDGISSAAPVATALARYQLLNQPGFTNAGNKPLAERQVTLSRSDLITFR